MSEPTRWKELALYLADCCAATAEYDGELKSTSKVRRERLARICEKAAVAIRGGPLMGTARSEKIVATRCEDAAQRLARVGRGTTGGTDGE
jgi:hypothetical protein